ncbi:hypothetical protein TNCV_2312131 [Trichonephila clavipes]|nr:hypothetical protein TNCV_2312131 [Trichonephila clavipes]
MALYRSPLTVTLWPSSFLKKYRPMIPPADKAHQTPPSAAERAAFDKETDVYWEMIHLTSILSGYGR